MDHLAEVGIMSLVGPLFFRLLNGVDSARARRQEVELPPDGIVRTQLMEVFVRREGRWMIEAYHNVDVKTAK